MSDLYHYCYSSSHRVMANVLKRKKMNGEKKKKIVTSYYYCCSTSDEMNLIEMMVMMKIQPIETENDVLKMNVMKICGCYYYGYDDEIPLHTYFGNYLPWWLAVWNKLIRTYCSSVFSPH